MTKTLINHGGISESIFTRFGVKPREVVDYSVNVSPLGVPECIRKAWPQWLHELTAYPTQDGDGIKRYYQKRFNLPSESILPGNGSTEMIYHLPRMLNWPRVHIPQPAFSEYKKACHIGGSDVLYDDLELNATARIIGSPNNPDGKAIPAAELLRMADEHPKQWLVVDQAFVQFCDPMDHYSLLNPDRLRPNLIVLHSLTKFYALPGLRMGAAIAHPDTISRLSAAAMPWAINHPAEQAASLLAEDDNYDHAVNKLIHAERPRMQNELKKLKSFKLIAESQGNYFLLQWQSERPLDELISKLLRVGYYVRDARSFSGLPATCIRIAVRTPEENNCLLEELRHV